MQMMELKMDGRNLKQRIVRNGLSWLSVFAVSLTAACQQEDTSNKQRQALESVPGSFIVEMNAETNSREEQKDQLISLAQPIAHAHGCVLEPPEEIHWETAPTGALPLSLNSSYHLLFSNCELDEEKTGQILQQLAEFDSINTVETNAIVTTNFRENDPHKRNQYYLQSINRDEACVSAGTKKSRPVIVAVLDSGVEKNHPDLVDQFYRDSHGRIVGANFVGKGSRGAPDDNWNDDHGHGTHVAGLVAATANNNMGIAGVAACANVKIMPVRVMNRSGRGSSLEIDRGIQWAAAHGADIINLSLGSNSFVSSRQASHKKALYEELSRKGVIVFAAAGNEGLINGSAYRSGMREGYIYSYPASYDKVIAVASTTNRNALSSFSNRGERVDIAAPGSNTLSTYPGRSYRYLSGTSMATPIAAASYALALASVRHSGSEKLFYDDIIDLYRRSVNRSVSFTSRDVSSGGIVDAKKLVELVQARFSPSSNPSASQSKPAQPSSSSNTQPESTVGKEGELSFVDLQPNQKLTTSIQISLQHWPEGTSHIDLYWITGQESSSPRRFTSLDRKNLSADGRSVTTRERYLLYGNRYLVAVAIGSNGQHLQQKSVFLQGL